MNTKPPASTAKTKSGEKETTGSTTDREKRQNPHTKLQTAVYLAPMRPLRASPHLRRPRVVFTRVVVCRVRVSTDCRTVERWRRASRLLTADLQLTTHDDGIVQRDGGLQLIDPKVTTTADANGGEEH